MSNNPELVAAFELLNSRLANLEQANVNLSSANDSLRKQLAQPPQPPTATNEPKAPLPTKFDGTRTLLRGFLLQLNLVFKLQPSRYMTDTSKVLTCGALLAGKALAWFNPICEQEGIPANAILLSSWSSFQTALDANFGVLDRAITAGHCIRALSQKDRTAASYAADFNVLAADLDWNDSALMAQFRSGLSGKIKDRFLAYQETTSLAEMVKLAIRIDARISEHEREMRSHHHSGPARPPFQPPLVPPPAMPFNAGSPMDLDAVTLRRPAGPLTPTEKAFRKKKGLCMYCGLAGHVVADCPSCPRTVASLSTSAAAAKTPPQDFVVG
jgi:hypothetical protein